MFGQRTVAVFAVAFLLVVAGCSGGGGGDGAATATPASSIDGEPGTADGQSATAGAPGAGASTRSPATPATSGPAGTPKASIGGDDTTVGRYLAKQPAAFRTAGGFVAELTSTTRRGNRSTGVRGTVRRDLGSGAMFARLDGTRTGRSNTTVEQYSLPGNETVVACMVSGEGCARKQRLPSSSQGYAPTEFLASVFPDDDYSDFESRGTVSTDLGDLEKFTAEGVDALPGGASGARSGNVTEFRMDLYFDADSKTLRKVHVVTAIETPRGGELRSEVTVTYATVGSVTVEKPDWYESDD